MPLRVAVVDAARVRVAVTDADTLWVPVRVPVGDALGGRVRLRKALTLHERDGDGVRVRDGVRDGVGMESNAGRHGSATPPDENDVGTADWP